MRTKCKKPAWAGFLHSIRAWLLTTFERCAPKREHHQPRQQNHAPLTQCGYGGSRYRDRCDGESHGHPANTPCAPGTASDVISATTAAAWCAAGSAVAEGVGPPATTGACPSAASPPNAITAVGSRSCGAPATTAKIIHRSIAARKRRRADGRTGGRGASSAIDAVRCPPSARIGLQADHSGPSDRRRCTAAAGELVAPPQPPQGPQRR